MLPGPCSAVMNNTYGMHREHVCSHHPCTKKFGSSEDVNNISHISDKGHSQAKGLHIDSLLQDCSNSIANALELLQSCAKLSIWCRGS